MNQFQFGRTGTVIVLVVSHAQPLPFLHGGVSRFPLCSSLSCPVVVYRNKCWLCILLSSLLSAQGDLKREHNKRVQWNQEKDDRAEYQRVRVSNENWALNQFNSKGKDEYAVQLFKCEKEIANLWRYSSIYRIAAEREWRGTWPKMTETRQEQDSCRMRNQNVVTPAVCPMPIEVVSVRVRAPALRENAFWSCVLDRAGRENEEIRGRPMWNQVELCVTVKDEETRRRNMRKCDQIFTTEAWILLVFWERMICLWDSAEEIAILLRNSSILNQQSTRIVNSWTGIEEKQTELLVYRRQMTETNQQQDSYTTRNQEWLQNIITSSTIGGLWWV